jgi:outer membrane protein assembly factor BamD
MITTKLLLATTLLPILMSCSSTPAPEPGEAVEIKAKGQSTLDLPEQELLTNAKRQFTNNLYSISKESFKAIKTNFPTGPYAEYAEIKMADCAFYSGDYSEALKAYEDYSKNKPSSLALPYVLLMAGRSAELSSGGVGRDPGPFQTAVGLYDQLISRFPNSSYSDAARQRKAGVLSILASHDLELINYYEAQGREEIATQRAKDFKKTYNVAPADYENIGYDKRAAISESAISQEDFLKAKNYATNLSFPKQNQMLTKTSMTSPNSESSSHNNMGLSTGDIMIKSVKCDSDSKILTLRLGPDPVKLSSTLRTTKNLDHFELILNNVSLDANSPPSYSCFANGDLTIRAISVSTQAPLAGSLLSLKSDKDIATAFFADNPARIIIKLR